MYQHLNFRLRMRNQYHPAALPNLRPALEDRLHYQYQIDFQNPSPLSNHHQEYSMNVLHVIEVIQFEGFPFRIHSRIKIEG